MKHSAGSLLLALVFVSGCAGTGVKPLPSYDTVVAKCKALEGPLETGVQPPRLMDKGKGLRGFLLGSGGYACVRATVTPEGTLADPEILETDSKTFADAFVRSLSGYVYEPARKDGAAVACKVVVAGWWSDAGQPQATP